MSQKCDWKPTGQRIASRPARGGRQLHLSDERQQLEQQAPKPAVQGCHGDVLACLLACGL